MEKEKTVAWNIGLPNKLFKMCSISSSAVISSQNFYYLECFFQSGLNVCPSHSILMTRWSFWYCYLLASQTLIHGSVILLCAGVSVRVWGGHGGTGEGLGVISPLTFPAVQISSALARLEASSKAGVTSAEPGILWKRPSPVPFPLPKKMEEGGESWNHPKSCRTCQTQSSF